MFAWMLIPLFETIDARLRRYGDFDSLQKFRLLVVKYYIKHDPRLKKFDLGGVLTKIVGFDMLLRYTVQWEETLKQKCQALNKKKRSQEEEKELKYCLSDLKFCSEAYWKQQRGIYEKEASLPAGPFRRAYDTYRSNPKWYLHPDLRNDCAGRGGCCGRQCGCCEKREPTPGRPRGVGHCTVQCGCCIDARGFEIQSQDLIDVMDEFLSELIFPDEENKTYYTRYMRAFFIGIESERDQAPKWI
ncbi:hypothetical protein N7519_005329 [Penicillium mononematosum]|uniref:uncharacterized protein n=1 Tax=Penicillium mononematosum TaxID=268346 RepID=UPI002548D2C3|nr:uncharacterized protein N7519_005329 [Penicillium mononematosum]KAJ6184028.1 hypothetical protein N7519_005329 [Penicillium mononematosum]